MQSLSGQQSTNDASSNEKSAPEGGHRNSNSTTPMIGLSKKTRDGHDSVKTERVSLCKSQKQEGTKKHDGVSTPLPPSRNSTTINSVCSKTISSTRQQRMDLSDVLQPSQTPKLPFPTASNGSRTGLNQDNQEK